MVALRTGECHQVLHLVSSWAPQASRALGGAVYRWPLVDASCDRCFGGHFPAEAAGAGSENSDPTFSGKYGPLRGSDNLPSRTTVEELRRREAKGDDRSHGQTSRTGTTRRRQDAAADRGGVRDPAAQREADRAGAGDRRARGRRLGARARRRPTERGRGVSRPDRRRAREISMAAVATPILRVRRVPFCKIVSRASARRGELGTCLDCRRQHLRDRAPFRSAVRPPVLL